MDIENITLEMLLENNLQRANSYKDSPLMQLIKSSKMESKENREKALGCIQVFSNYFQRTVLLRSVLNDDDDFFEVIQEHMEEEFCHNRSLMKDRNYKPPIWDAVLDATSSWFAWKMFTLDNEGITVLMHFVLETSANIFFQEAHIVMRRYNETNYFKIHAEADEKHEKMGRELLRGLTPKKYKKLLKVQNQGWDVLNATCERISKLIHG